MQKNQNTPTTQNMETNKPRLRIPIKNGRTTNHVKNVQKLILQRPTTNPTNSINNIGKSIYNKRNNNLFN